MSKYTCSFFYGGAGEYNKEDNYEWSLLVRQDKIVQDVTESLCSILIENNHDLSDGDRRRRNRCPPRRQGLGQATKQQKQWLQ
jgi:hypothetical protein